jgi:hypothetical protein
MLAFLPVREGLAPLAAILPCLVTNREQRKSLIALSALQITLFPKEGHVRRVEDVWLTALEAM